MKNKIFRLVMSVISLIKFNKFILIIFSNYSFEVNMIKTKEIENKRNILHSYFSTISHSLLKMLEKGRPDIYSLEIDKIISPRTEDKSDSFHIDSHQPLLQSVIIRPWNTERHSSLSQNRVTPVRSQGQDEFEPPPCSAIFIFSFPRKWAGNKLIIQGQRVHTHEYLCPYWKIV